MNLIYFNLFMLQGRIWSDCRCCCIVDSFSGMADRFVTGFLEITDSAMRPACWGFYGMGAATGADMA